MIGWLMTRMRASRFNPAQFSEHQSRLETQIEEIKLTSLLILTHLQRMERRQMQTDDLINQLIATEAANEDTENSAINVITGLLTQLSDEIANMGLTPDQITKVQTVINKMQNASGNLAAAVASGNAVLTPVGATPPPATPPATPPADAPPATPPVTPTP